MARFFKQVAQKLGASPGTLMFIGKKKTDSVKIHVFDYAEKKLEEKDLHKAEDCFTFKNKKNVTWINIDGLHQTEIVEKIGSYYGIHAVVLEDILNTQQRPKIEIFDDHMVIILKMLTYDEKKHSVEAEQVSFVLGKNFVLSFQEKEGDVFGPVRERIRNATGKIRKMGADYLTYSLIDMIVDNYFVILERIGEQLEGHETSLMNNPKKETLNKIYDIKRELLFLRKCIWPVREIVASLDRSESSLVQSKTNVYIRDLYDHTIQVIDTVETFKDMISGMLDLYLSTISNKMNEIMKVLTMISTIFIPLTFISGVYGMNFENMPELTWQSGYYIILGVMFFVAVVFLFFFKRRGWLNS